MISAISKMQKNANFSKKYIIFNKGNKQGNMENREFTSKKQIEGAIREQITTKESQAVKAMLRIYEYQTVDEQINGDVCTLNGVGFAGTDAELLTSFCKRVLKGNQLSEKQLAILFKKIGKYAGQLTRQAIKNGLYVKEGKTWTVAKKLNEF